ncbi:YSIRK-type signal peptide-containing protein [Streptococcus castoreus]
MKKYKLELKKQPLDQKQLKYGIKRLSVGVASVVIGATFSLYSAVAYAEEANSATSETRHLAKSEEINANDGTAMDTSPVAENKQISNEIEQPASNSVPTSSDTPNLGLREGENLELAISDLKKQIADTEETLKLSNLTKERRAHLDKVLELFKERLKVLEALAGKNPAYPLEPAKPSVPLTKLTPASPNLGLREGENLDLAISDLKKQIADTEETLKLSNLTKERRAHLDKVLALFKERLKVLEALASKNPAYPLEPAKPSVPLTKLTPASPNLGLREGENLELAISDLKKQIADTEETLKLSNLTKERRAHLDKVLALFKERLKVLEALASKNPAYPLEPAKPSVPLTKLTPANPVTPAKPSVPLTKLTPASPVTPAKPNVPLTKLTPASPVTPAKPSVPLTKLTPASPVTPAKPSVPLTKLMPATSSKPTQSHSGAANKTQSQNKTLRKTMLPRTGTKDTIILTGLGTASLTSGLALTSMVKKKEN